MDTEVIVMIVVWAVVIGAALLIEFLTYSFVSAWFAVGGFAAIITAPLGLYWPWQILVFVCVSFLFLLSMRPLVKRFVKVKTQPTNLDMFIGRKYKLLKDVENGKSEIQINDIIWTVKCDDQMKKGDTVEILDMEGNKYIVGGLKS